MNRKRVAKIATFLFLVQSLTTARISAGTFALNPPLKVSLTESENPIIQLESIVRLAQVIYELDALKRYSKEVIRETLLRDYPHLLTIVSDIGFIDKGKKGWTRYYRVSIGEKWYLIRVFLTEEVAFQPKVPVLFEVKTENPAITFQIIPNVNDILKDRKIEPASISSGIEAARSV